jgi:hypothetical protein
MENLRQKKPVTPLEGFTKWMITVEIISFWAIKEERKKIMGCTFHE